MLNDAGKKIINLLKNVLQAWSVVFYLTKAFDALEDIKKYSEANKSQALIFAFFRLLEYVLIVLINLISFILTIIWLIISYPIFEKALLALTICSTACLLFCIIFSIIEYASYVYYNTDPINHENKNKILKNITFDSILLIQLVAIILALYFLPPYSSIFLSFCITIIYNIVNYFFYQEKENIKTITEKKYPSIEDTYAEQARDYSQNRNQYDSILTDKKSKDDPDPDNQAILNKLN